jgi:hypothetical protein
MKITILFLILSALVLLTTWQERRNWWKIVFGFFAAFYYWFPKMMGRRLDPLPGRVLSLDPFLCLL